MLAENTPSYPRSFLVQMQFTGPLQSDALEAAWRATLLRHPLLSAMLERSRGGWQWILNDNPVSSIDWAGLQEPIHFPRGEMIDLATEPGVRFWVRAGHDSARLLLQFHHATCDGIGGLLTVRDLLAEYVCRTGSNAPALPPLDVELLKSRDSFHIGALGFREWLGHAGATLGEAVRLLGRRPAPLALPSQPDSDEGLPAPFPGMVIHALTPDELGSLQESSRALGATINDLMIAHALGAIVDWNEAQGCRQPGDWLRINMPTSLRMPGDEQMPVANVMSFAFVDRRVRDCRDRCALVKSIQAETEAIKLGRRGLYFIAQLGNLSSIPGAMRLALSSRRCFATAVVSNVGDLGRFFPDYFPRQKGRVVAGNLVLEDIVGTPPLRPLTRAGLGVLTYAGRMSLCLLCDRNWFTTRQSRQFLEMLRKRIAAGIPCTAPAPG